MCVVGPQLAVISSRLRSNALSLPYAPHMHVRQGVEPCGLSSATVSVTEYTYSVDETVIGE